jgi:GNAT superfamily N-acetyltransferase
MNFTLRPLMVPADYPRMVELINATAPEPTTVERLAENDRILPADIIVHREAAVGADGVMVGYGVAARIPSEQPGRFKVRVLVDPAYRGQGAGTLLADAMERFALSLGATWLDSHVRDNAPEALSFAEKRGYTVREHVFDSVLDLASFDESRFAGAVEKVEAGGIRFVTYAEVAGEEAALRLYELSRNTMADTPGAEEEVFPPFELWRKGFLEVESTRLDCILIAVDGDRWAGFTLLAPNPANGSMYNGGTGVAREYRGRGLALALKLLSIRKARELGAPYMRTDNHAKNAPMLAINRKLGYVPRPGTYQLQKRV